MSKTGIENYIEKAMYLMKRQGFYCAIGNLEGKKYKATDVHHRLHNTKPNRKVFPLFINSVFNLWLVNNDLHLQHPSAGKVSLIVAKEIELRLEADYRIREWSNNPTVHMADGLYACVKAIYALLDEEVKDVEDKKEIS